MNPLLLALIALAAKLVTSHPDDPEVSMDTPQIIQYWGYPTETLTTTTQDGYILTLHRIPHGRNDTPCPYGQKRPVVFMQHGLGGESSNWIVNLPNESAGFIFADAGFDVWLGNVRGNVYSQRHKTLSPRSRKFWEFSWDEMVQYDLDSMISKVLEVTGQPYVHYIGHSQGTMIMFSKLSVDPIFSAKIKNYFALAPVGTVKGIKGLVKVVGELFTLELELWLRAFGSGQFMPRNKFIDTMGEYICGGKRRAYLCSHAFFLTVGPESNQFNETREDVYIGQGPAGTSTQNILHWAQMVRSGKVSRFDYGNAKKNQLHYGQATPPSYNFSSIQTNTYLFWSDEDWLADRQDIEGYLLPALQPAYLKRNTHLRDYNHIDYIWGLNAAKDIYHPIIRDIQQDHGRPIKKCE